MIPERVLDQIKIVASYAGECDDWVTIKKEIMKGCPPHLRKKFSRRHPITKEQIPNDFDHSVIDKYRSITSINLIIRTLEERRKLRD